MKDKIKIEYCKKCTTSNQRPNTSIEFKNTKNTKKSFINFSDGICDACKYSLIKETQIDWDQREKELIQLLNKFRKNDGNYDCIVPGSGGKDSVYTAYLLKFKYNMNPLLVTWPPILPTNEGLDNFHSWLRLGFANYSHYPNQKVNKVLTRLAFQNLYHPFQPFTIGQKNLAPKTAMSLNVKLIFYGEHEAERGSDIKTTISSKRDINSFASTTDDINDIFLAGLPIGEIMKEHKFKKNDFIEYLPSKLEEIKKYELQFHYLGYFTKWHPMEIYYHSAFNSNFKPNSERTEGSYSKFSSIDDKIDWLHYYARYIKFGQGRATSDTSVEIRDKDITRDEGIRLVKKFDGEFPKKYLTDCLEYMEIDEDEFLDVTDKFRSPNLWQKKYGKWELRYPIWKDKTVEKSNYE